VNKRNQNAFSLVELLTVISIIAILAALLLSALVSAKARSRQAACINNLRQIGLGFTTFALDHDGKYSMDVPERLGGSSEYNDSRLITNTPFSRDFHHFVVLSNEVPNVKVMTCPADRKRRPAQNYQTFTNDNLSYWANTRAIPHATLASLAGDWNAYNASGKSNDWEQINFGREVHNSKGSVLFADGRVEITRSLAMQRPQPSDAIAATTPSTSPTTQAGVAPGARPQPNAPKTPTPAPATSPIPTTTPAAKTTSQPPEVGRELPPTNDVNVITFSSSQQKRFSGYRSAGISQDGPSKPAPIPDNAIPTISGPAQPTAPGDSEPWDTPGFRIFKFLAILSYLFSLLWAIIALLVLYLRARIAQRQQEEQASINVD
jgi:prepilin-type N-terminal cleavage/methylation domain-containing protein/prepilin-type processing-associated H-X9-DG protein